MSIRIAPAQNPSPKATELLEATVKSVGKKLNIFATMANSPATLAAYLGAQGAVNENSTLSAALREQLSVAVAGANGCDYCASAHTALGKMHKVNEMELAQNLSAKSTDAKTQAALTFARTIVDTRGHVTDADVKAVRDAGYSDSELLDILTVTCINIFTNYFNEVAGTAIDFPVFSTAEVKKAA